MGKRKKADTVGQIAGKDNFQRMNFLYQMAHTVMSVNPNNAQLARYYTSTLKRISKNCVQRQDPSVKRTICKRCDSLLIPGVTATVRIRAKREKHVVVTCLECRMVRRFLARKDYQLWTELPTSLGSQRKTTGATDKKDGSERIADKKNHSETISSSIEGKADQ
ncbi:RPP21 [Branchiostoma lanceolatum]|uniref:RPP21 protein n=1 Tax=Branchiostoma lanceolatum TaxID=7740 RepID=A0A8K0AJ32_BRALA|nr:RPP21 [Branchiostoma lanceolatum]